MEMAPEKTTEQNGRDSERPMFRSGLRRADEEEYRNEVKTCSVVIVVCNIW